MFNLFVESVYLLYCFLSHLRKLKVTEKAHLHPTAAWGHFTCALTAVAFLSINPPKVPVLTLGVFLILLIIK